MEKEPKKFKTLQELHLEKNPEHSTTKILEKTLEEAQEGSIHHIVMFVEYNSRVIKPKYDPMYMSEVLGLIEVGKASIAQGFQEEAGE